MASDDDKKMRDLVEHIATTTLYSREQARDMLRRSRGAGLGLGLTLDLINGAYGTVDLATACDIAMGTLEVFSLGRSDG